jgi:isopenicillin N synthase-like dioxygenase
LVFVLLCSLHTCKKVLSWFLLILDFFFFFNLIILQIISNDNYISVEHRVLAKASKEPRISIVLFFNVADFDYYGPLPELLSPNKPALYRKFTMPEFLESFFSKELDSKSFIQKVKL